MADITMPTRAEHFDAEKHSHFATLMVGLCLGAMSGSIVTFWICLAIIRLFS